MVCSVTRWRVPGVVRRPAHAWLIVASNSMEIGRLFDRETIRESRAKRPATQACLIDRGVLAFSG